MIYAVAAIAILVGAAWYLFKDNESSSKAPTEGNYKRHFKAVDKTKASTKSLETKIHARPGNVITFYFASQTGTAEEFASIMAKQATLREYHASSFDLEKFRCNQCRFLYCSTFNE